MYLIYHNAAGFLLLETEKETKPIIAKKLNPVLSQRLTQEMNKLKKSFINC